MQGHETTVEIELGGEKFSAQGLMIIAKNYLEIYIYDRWNAKVSCDYYNPEKKLNAESVERLTVCPEIFEPLSGVGIVDKG